MRIKGIIGVILIVFEFVAVYGNFSKYGTIIPPCSSGASMIGFAIGYFLPLILGVLLVVWDLKGRSRR